MKICYDRCINLSNHNANFRTSLYIKGKSFFYTLAHGTSHSCILDGILAENWASLDKIHISSNIECCPIQEGGVKIDQSDFFSCLPPKSFVMVHYKTSNLKVLEILQKKNPNRPNYFFDFPIIGSKIKVVVDPSSDLSKQARERH